MIEPREFRNTVGHFATGITVITTINGKEKIGLTANAFSSLSLDPPLILVCIDKRSGSLKALKRDHPFAVNLLKKSQETECWRYAKSSGDKFEGAAYKLSEEGVPILEDNLATIECVVADIIEGGDHYIVTGLVKNASYDDQGEPLIFFRGKIEQLELAKTVEL
ncbi:flavin reductase family protein [Sporosarcina sp. FSL W7-1283]|uniref:flavin reductase family protein n=1 Tax=Sporosarcina sp. FSL W7-1283 TaxID=2921560 RepID=UPI0030F737D8